MTRRVQAALRPFLPTDGAILAEIFRSSIEGLTGDDYDEDQQAAWMAAADDEDVFATRLGAMLTLVATVAGAPVGFASLKDAEIDMLYVHPGAARQGVATLLVDALERLAAARGLASLGVNASDTARDLFAARGYTALHRQTVPRGGEWLGNTRMEKALAKGSRP